MATTTPVWNNSALTSVNVTASPSARNGITSATGEDTISPVQRVQLARQFCCNRIQEYREAAACAMIRTNAVMIAYIVEVNLQCKRKRSTAIQEHNKKAKKAKKKVAKKLQIDSGPFNSYVAQKDRQLTTEEKRIHLGVNHFLNEPSPRPLQDARILKRELDTNYNVTIKVPLPPRNLTIPMYRV